MIELREELTQSQVNNYKQILYKNCVMASGSKGIMAILAEWFKGLDLGLMRWQLTPVICTLGEDYIREGCDSQRRGGQSYPGMAYREKGTCAWLI